MQGTRTVQIHADRTPLLLPGEVISGNVVNGLENRHASGKGRLVVVVEVPEFGSLKVIGLTSKAVTRTGEKRIELHDNQAWRWGGRSFVWGPTRLSRHDVYDHVGWVSESDAETLARRYGLHHDWMTNAQLAVA